MRHLIGLLIIFTFSACTPTKVVKPSVVVEEFNTEDCINKVMLLDYTSNGNCGFLFQLEDGTKLLPATMPESSVPFVDRDFVVIGYRAFDEVETQTNSQCGIEDMVVEVLCIKPYVDLNSNIPRVHDDCKSVKNVFTNSWMPEIVQELKPQKISEYEYAVGYLYNFEVSEVSHLYDCLGNKMCSSDDGGDCKSLIETLGNETVIQVFK